MLTQNEVVSLLIDGAAHQDWETYEIDSDLLIPSDAWQVGIGLNGKQLPDFVAPWSQVLVKVGNETVLKGYVDAIEDIVEKNHHSLLLTGRDQAAVLLDCAAPIFTARKLSLPEVISSIVRPLGVHKVRIDTVNATGRKKVNIEPGERGWSALQKAAEANGLWPWFEPDGTLVVGGPNYGKAAVATLVMRKNDQKNASKNNNVISIRRNRQVDQHYSQVTVLGQGHGDELNDGQHAIKATAKDRSVNYYRPQIVAEYDVDTTSQANSQARKQLADSMLNSFDLIVKVRGHRTESGLLWTPGQRLVVESEPHQINETFFLMGRRLIKSRSQGTITELRLKQDKRWVLDAYPHDRTQRKLMEAA